MAARTAVKRKRVVLSIEDKIDILKLLDKSVSYSVVCEKYGIGRSTVGDIKKNRLKIMNFKAEMVDMGMSKKAKVMKIGDDKKLDKAVYVWFKQKRMEGVPVSGPMLREKAMVLSKAINDGEPSTAFTASEGWKWRFCKRHGIRQLSLQGEKLSADTEAAVCFVASFSEFVEEKDYSIDQIFNCDETGLNFRLLPDKTLAASFEKSADGRKKSKERVTLNVCSNASGTINLPLHLIGKARKPRCFKGVNMDLLPVKYSGQKNAWMESGLFQDWFHHTFVPFVRTKLTELGQECRAILVLDNCSAHPDSSELVSDDGKITVKFLPPNVTSLIQPMDQGVLQAVKRRYKKKLLRALIIGDDRGVSLIDFLKSVTMKTVVNLVAEAWKEIEPSTLRKSWQKILPIHVPSFKSRPDHPYASGPLSELFKQTSDYEKDTECLSLPAAHASSKYNGGHAYWRGLRIRLSHHDTDIESPAAIQPDESVNLDEFQNMFKELGFEIDNEKIDDWLESDCSNSGIQIYTDDEICDMVSKDEVEEPVDSEEEEEVQEEESRCPVSNSDAAHYFEQCMLWLEHQPEASVYNTSVLRQLQSLVANKRIDSLKQSKINNFFPSV